MGIAGIIIGIIGLAVALLAVLLAGWIGGVVAIVLGSPPSSWASSPAKRTVKAASALSSSAPSPL